MVLEASSRGALPADIRTAWQRLGEPAALSLPVALIYLPLALAGPLFIDTRRVGGSIALWFAVGVIGWLVLLAMLTAGRWVIAPMTRGRSLTTLAAIGLSVIARSAAIALSAQWLGLTSVSEFSYRLTAALFTQSALLIASAIVVSSFVHHGEIAADLLDRRQQLAHLSQESRVRLAHLRQQIREQVRQAVDPIITQLNEVSANAVGGREGLQMGIRHIVDEELRPLSQRLADAASVPESDAALVGLKRPSRPPLPDRISLGQLLRPLPSGLLAALLASSQAARMSSVLEGLLFILALSASLAVIVAILRRVLIPVVVPLWWGFTFVTMTVAVLFALIVMAWEQTPLPMPPDLRWAALYSGAFIGALLALEYIVNERRTVTENQLRESVEELQAHASMLRQQEFMASRQLSYVVHGSVQSALHAAAMRLSLAQDPGGETVAMIRADIEEAIDRIDTSGSAYVMLVQTLVDLVDLWAGTAQVAWTMNHRTVRRLAESPPTAASVGEIATECTSNAIRHGRAQHVSITIQAWGDAIRMSVTDDGSGVPSIIEPRLGTRMLEELCVEWNRRSTEEGTTVTVELATERSLALPT